MKCSNLKSVFIGALLLTLITGCSKSNQTDKLYLPRDIDGVFYQVQRQWRGDAEQLRKEYEAKYSKEFPKGTLFVNTAYPQPDYIPALKFSPDGTFRSGKAKGINEPVEWEAEPSKYSFKGDSLFYTYKMGNEIWTRLRVRKDGDLYFFDTGGTVQGQAASTHTYIKSPTAYNSIVAKLKAQTPEGYADFQ